MWSFIFRYEWIHFRRNRLQVGLLVILMGMGLMAIYGGNRQITAQRLSLEKTRRDMQTEWRGYRVAFNLDTTNKANKQTFQLATDPAFAWYRQGYLAQLDESVLSPLAIGQRDLSPVFYRLTGMSLYYQIFQTELANPVKLLVGNLDLSFVLIYLLPLFVIALSFTLLSGDKEAGLLPLLHVQAASVRGVLLGKLLFAFGLVTGVSVGLSVLGFVLSGVNWSRDIGPMAGWLLTVVAYSGFWFGLVWAIVSYNRNSAVNALLSVGCWLLFLVVVPSLLSAFLTVARPVNSSDLATLARRESIDNEQDEAVMRAIIHRYKRLQPAIIPTTDTTYHPNLSAKGYDAFTQLNDARHRPMVEVYWQSVAARDELARRFNVLNPAVNAQELLSLSAHTDLTTSLHFWRSLPAFHQQIGHFYNIRLFRNKSVSLADLSQRPTYQPPVSQSTGRISIGVIQLIITAGLLFSLGWFNLAKRLH